MSLHLPPENRLFIDNQWVEPISKESFASIDPATEKTITRTAFAGEADVARAAEASLRAKSGEWGDMSPEHRGRIVARMGQLIAERAEEIAALETADMGKPLTESRGNVVRSVRTFEYYAGAVDKLTGDSIPVGSNAIAFTMLEPIGVTAHVTPWNYPFANACRSLPTALAAGCTAIVKPASVTPLTTLLLGEIAVEAGLPPGVLGILPGDGRVTGAALVEHPLVRGVTFTGSVSTGRQIAAAAARRLIPTVLELGGKNPQIVFADADLESALAHTMRGSMTNAGQVCTSVSRVLVERAVYPRYVEALAERISELTIGPGTDPVDVGPLVSREHRDAVARFVDVAEYHDGARRVLGGGRPAGMDVGFFFEPALFDEVAPDMTIAREEVFGPILCVLPFDSEQQALEIANSLALGLSAGIFTQDVSRALRFVRQLEAGMVWVNDWFLSPVQVPHGGVKDSGIGREQGMQALNNYTQIKMVGMRSV